MRPALSKFKSRVSSAYLSMSGRSKALAGVVSIAVVGTIALAASQAAGTIYLQTTAQPPLALGDQFVVQVRTNASEGVASQIDVSYPADKLELVSHDLNGAIFTSSVGQSDTNGVFKITTYEISTDSLLSGEDVLLANLTFRVIDGTGTADIDLLPTAAVVFAGNRSADVGNGLSLQLGEPAEEDPLPSTSVIYISPSTATVKQGQSLTAQVKATATSGNSADIIVNYPSDKLVLETYDVSGGVFPELPPSLVQNIPGRLQFVAYSINSVTPLDNSLLLSLRFKALSNSGSDVISLDAESVVVDVGELRAVAGTGTTVTFQPADVAPPPAPNPTPTPTPTPTPKPTSTSVTRPQQSSTSTSTQRQTSDSSTPANNDSEPEEQSQKPALTINSDSADGLSVQWKTSSPAKSKFQYGLEQSQLANTIELGESTEHIASLDPRNVVIGATMYYKITATSTEATGEPVIEGSYMIPQAKLRLVTADGKVLGETTVKVSGKTFVSNKDGEVTISGVNASTSSMQLQVGGEWITVDGLNLVAGINDVAEVQLPSENNRKSPNITYGVLAGVAVMVLILGGVLAYSIARKRSFGSASTSATGVQKGYMTFGPSQNNSDYDDRSQT